MTTIVFPRIGIGLEEYRRNIVYRGWSRRRLVYFKLKLKTILTFLPTAITTTLNLIPLVL